MIYSLILRLRHLAYDKGWKKSQPSPVPSVCVGNVTVGGTGKTPHTEMIVRKLIESHCWPDEAIAVLSRGYGRRSKGFQKVTPDSKASLSGDEPLQIARKFPSISVAVDKDRINGCKMLENASVVILDDAFQYRRLRCSLNLVLVDFNRPVFRDRLLPFGRLRDLPSRIRKAHAVIVTKCPPELEDADREAWRRSLKLSEAQKLFFTRTAYMESEPVFPEADKRFLYSKNLVLLSGIANDSPLSRYLSDTYTISSHLAFPDHHSYTRADVRKISALSKENPTACLMTTEKDAQRLREAPSMPLEIKQRLFYVPISATFLTPEEDNSFTTLLLESLGGARLL